MMATQNSPGDSRVDRYGRKTSPQSVMTVDSFIATHPELWAVMGYKYRSGDEDDPYQGGVLDGMVQALVIVGGFTVQAISDRLREDFG